MGQPRCFMFVDENGDIEPKVYIFRNRHPDIVPRLDEALRVIEYVDLDELIADGWRPYSANELDVGLSNSVPR